MSRHLPPLLVGLLLAACASAPSETERINSWFDAQYEQELAFKPIQQTMLGRKTDNDKINDMSIEGDEAQLAWRRASVQAMRDSFHYDALSPLAQESWDLWIYQLAQAEAAQRFQTNQYVFTQMQGVHTFLATFLISFHRVEDAADLNAYVARIGESARALKQLIVRARSAADSGVRPPAFTFPVVIAEATALISGAPFDDGAPNAVWADFLAERDSLLAHGKIDSAAADAATSAARSALTGPWKEAYGALVAWEEEDAPHASSAPGGSSALPNGPAYYAERLANETTTALTADDIHEIGLREVARLSGEMSAIKEQVGFQGTLPAFFRSIRESTDNPKHFFPNTDEGRQGYLDAATAAIARIKEQLPNYFGILPKADIVVRRVEAFREQPGAAQHYYPGTPDGSRPGTYYAHLIDMSTMPKGELEVIAYHEGLPGHHMQISIAQELMGIPMFRTQAGFGAYIEGWGLYSEWLAREMPGTYQDPYSQLGRLGSEIWRAARLVLDTGLHSKGWTEQQAVDYFLANTTATEGTARSEVQRYLVMPGQATSYKIGMLRIQALRQKAETALGDRFDLRAFHDTVLGGGALPLDMLEARVDRWIASMT